MIQSMRLLLDMLDLKVMASKRSGLGVASRHHAHTSRAVVLHLLADCARWHLKVVINEAVEFLLHL